MALRLRIERSYLALQASAMTTLALSAKWCLSPELHWEATRFELARYARSLQTGVVPILGLEPRSTPV